MASKLCIKTGYISLSSRYPEVSSENMTETHTHTVYLWYLRIKSVKAPTAISKTAISKMQPDFIIGHMWSQHLPMPGITN